MAKREVQLEGLGLPQGRGRGRDRPRGPPAPRAWVTDMSGREPLSVDVVVIFPCHAMARSPGERSAANAAPLGAGGPPMLLSW